MGFIRFTGFRCLGFRGFRGFIGCIGFMGLIGLIGFIGFRGLGFRSLGVFRMFPETPKPMNSRI